jgi:hypothetical protein
MRATRSAVIPEPGRSPACHLPIDVSTRVSALDVGEKFRARCCALENSADVRVFTTLRA